MSDRIDSLETATDFNDELEALLAQAMKAEIDVEGGWAVRNGEEFPDWDVVITEVAKPTGSD